MAELWSRILQPAQQSTALAFLAMIFIGVYFMPDSAMKAREDTLNLLHLTSFSVWVGSQFWVTFIAGLTMIKILPRHLFGEVQSCLFRKYFLIGTILSGFMAATFVLMHPLKTWSGEVKFQGISLFCICLATVLNFILFEPMTVKYMRESHRYEKEHGKGEGERITAEAEKNKELQEDPNYTKIRNKFFICHGVSTTVNLVSFAACGFHLWFLAKRIAI